MVRRIIKYFFLVSAHSVEFIISNLCKKIFPRQFQKLTCSLMGSYAFAMPCSQARCPKLPALKPVSGWESSGVWPREGGNALGGAWVSVLGPRLNFFVFAKDGHVLSYLISYHVTEWSGLGMNTWAELHPWRTRNFSIPHLSSPAVPSPQLHSAFSHSLHFPALPTLQ